MSRTWSKNRRYFTGESGSCCCTDRGQGGGVWPCLNLYSAETGLVTQHLTSTQATDLLNGLDP